MTPTSTGAPLPSTLKASTTTMANSNSSTPPASFSINERVLCYHGPLIYEAKILKQEHFDESNLLTGEVGPHFFVHYKGWKQTYAFIVS